MYPTNLGDNIIRAQMLRSLIVSRNHGVSFRWELKPQKNCSYCQRCHNNQCDGEKDVWLLYSSHPPVLPYTPPLPPCHTRIHTHTLVISTWKPEGKRTWESSSQNRENVDQSMDIKTNRQLPYMINPFCNLAFILIGRTRGICPTNQNVLTLSQQGETQGPTSFHIHFKHMISKWNYPSQRSGCCFS